MKSHQANLFSDSPTSAVPQGWTMVTLDDVLVPIDGNRTLHHGWSPQCEKEPSIANDVWGVLKTTAIQDGQFLPEHNKRLPDKLEPKPALEVKVGDMLITCAGPRSRCGVPCYVRMTRPRLILSGKMYRFRVNELLIEPRYLEAYLRAPKTQLAIDAMKTGISDSGLNLTHDLSCSPKMSQSDDIESRPRKGL
jgi:type I restriction enzyme S subunit